MVKIPDTPTLFTMLLEGPTVISEVVTSSIYDCSLQDQLSVSIGINFDFCGTKIRFVREFHLPKSRPIPLLKLAFGTLGWIEMFRNLFDTGRQELIILNVRYLFNSDNFSSENKIRSTTEGVTRNNNSRLLSNRFSLIDLVNMWTFLLLRDFNPMLSCHSCVTRRRDLELTP